MRKLIYFTLGNNIRYINLAKLCINSLYRANYDGHFLFITDLKNEILNNIHFEKEPYFMDVNGSDLLMSSANKLKIYNFDKINEFDKIIFSDLDILWLRSPDIIFDLLIDDKIYMSNEEPLMLEEHWGGKIFEHHEKLSIIEKKIKGLNAGLFAFNKNCVFHFEKIYSFLNENRHLVNICLEQPFINTYVYRNDIYDTKLNEYVTHDGYYRDSYDGVALHFAGGPGSYEIKYSKMLEYFNRNLI